MKIAGGEWCRGCIHPLAASEQVVAATLDMIKPGVDGESRLMRSRPIGGLSRGHATTADHLGTARSPDVVVYAPAHAGVFMRLMWLTLRHKKPRQQQ